MASNVYELRPSQVLTKETETAEDEWLQRKLRPKNWDEFIGHEDEVKVLRRLLDAAKQRGEVTDHVVFHGPPGTGKTALAELALEDIGDHRSIALQKANTGLGMAKELFTLQPKQALFVDEIHGLNPKATEYLQQAMEGTGFFHNVGVPFTLIGATTKLGMLSQPLKDRFGLIVYIDRYQSCLDEKIHDRHEKSCSYADLNKIVTLAAGKLDMEMATEAEAEVAQRSRGVPRIAGRLLRRVRDVSSVPTQQQVQKLLQELHIDALGLDEADRAYIRAISDRYNGGPVGIATLAGTLGEAKETLLEGIEPFLFRIGMVEVLPRGRHLTPAGMRYAKVLGK